MKKSIILMALLSLGFVFVLSISSCKKKADDATKTDNTEQPADDQPAGDTK